MSQMATANALRDGAVVFLAANGNWVRDIAAASVAGSEAEAAALLQAAEKAALNNEVVAPYLIKVEASPHGPVPVEIRELIRANGPTV